MHHETRVVDKGGCITFKNQLYEVSAALIGAQVMISYDPMAPESLLVHYKDLEPIKAFPVKIGAFCDRKPELPLAMQPEEPATSQFLDVLEKQHENRRARMTNAISFGTYRKDGE